MSWKRHSLWIGKRKHRIQHPQAIFYIDASDRSNDTDNETLSSSPTRQQQQDSPMIDKPKNEPKEVSALPTTTEKLPTVSKKQDSQKNKSKKSATYDWEYSINVVNFFDINLFCF